MHTCPTSNTVAVDQTSFWSSSGFHWDDHRIGWVISGGCTVLTVIISIFSILTHCLNYTVPAEQRQMWLLFALYAIEATHIMISFKLFMRFLIIEYIASTSDSHNARSALMQKDKRKLPIPFCCWRYRPTKAYFLYAVKWSVLQYAAISPLLAIAGIICQALNILCEDQGFLHFEYAYVYIETIDFISISVSLYGLLMFYGLTKEELKGKRPLAKFLCIKLIVAFTFYQSIVFSLLEGRVIKATEFWSESNIADGLNALTICVEMVFFAAAMLWAYPATSYKHDGVRTSIWRPLWDSINFTDFTIETWGSLKFFIDYLRGKPGTHTPKTDFVQAFGTTGKGNLSDESTESYNDVESGVIFDSGLVVQMRNINSDRGGSIDEKEETVRLMPMDVAGPQSGSGSVSALADVAEGEHVPYDPPESTKTY